MERPQSLLELVKDWKKMQKCLQDNKGKRRATACLGKTNPKEYWYTGSELRKS